MSAGRSPPASRSSQKKSANSLDLASTTAVVSASLSSPKWNGRARRQALAEYWSAFRLIVRFTRAPLAPSGKKLPLHDVALGIGVRPQFDADPRRGVLLIERVIARQDSPARLKFPRNTR